MVHKNSSIEAKIKFKQRLEKLVLIDKQLSKGLDQISTELDALELAIELKTKKTT